MLWIFTWDGCLSYLSSRLQRPIPSSRLSCSQAEDPTGMREAPSCLRRQRPQRKPLCLDRFSEHCPKSSVEGSSDLHQPQVTPKLLLT